MKRRDVLFNIITSPERDTCEIKLPSTMTAAQIERLKKLIDVVVMVASEDETTDTLGNKEASES